MLSCVSGFYTSLDVYPYKGMMGSIMNSFIDLTKKVMSRKCLYLSRKCQPLFRKCQPLSTLSKVSKGAKIRNRYNQVPHLTQDTNGKETNSHLYTTNESQEVSLFPAGDHKAQINRHTQRHNKHKTEKT